jgi:hypothetical protein
MSDKANSNEAKDFGEVLVALGQGKTIHANNACLISVNNNKLEILHPSYTVWDIYHHLTPEDFSYPALIYEEPKTVEIDVWVNVYSNGVKSGIYFNKADASACARSERIACINIKRTVTEGEGLE